MCGEKSSRLPRRLKNAGSPPRMRGKVYAHRSARVRCGITPAYAGKSSYTSDRAAVSRDHPRVCGEKYWRHSCPQMRSGSPPRMRGKARYIAASVALFWDHPRVCGEKKKMNMRKDKRMGSPPRMRGKADYTPVVDVRVRITPAYAGKRSAWPSVLRRQRDHPRVCGEKLPVRRAAAGRAGSPPRMRGKVAAISAYNAAPGITPAYAGKSTLHRDDAPLSWDHPRVCGEKSGEKYEKYSI